RKETWVFNVVQEYAPLRWYVRDELDELHRTVAQAPHRRIPLFVIARRRLGFEHVHFSADVRLGLQHTPDFHATKRLNDNQGALVRLANELQNQRGRSYLMQA